MLDIFSGINILEIEDKACMYLKKNKLYCGLWIKWSAKFQTMNSAKVKKMQFLRKDFTSFEPKFAKLLNQKIWGLYAKIFF